MKQVYMSLFALVFMSVPSLDAMESGAKSAVSAPKGWSYYAKVGGGGFVGSQVGWIIAVFICNSQSEEHKDACGGLMLILGASVGSLAAGEYAKRSSLKIKANLSEKQS